MHLRVQRRSLLRRSRRIDFTILSYLHANVKMLAVLLTLFVLTRTKARRAAEGEGEGGSGPRRAKRREKGTRQGKGNSTRGFAMETKQVHAGNTR